MDLGNLIIFGDSYSTFIGSIPEGFAHYYGRNDTEGCGVTSEDKTWWRLLINECGGNLLENNSWSGSTLGYTGYNGDCSKTNSFIFRLQNLIDDGFFEKNTVDTVLVFGGTNDSWANAPVGEVKEGEIPWEERFLVLPAFCYFASLLGKCAPDARVIFIVNSELNPEIELGIPKAAELYGHDSVVLRDIDKHSGHPTALGMVQIKDQIKAVL